ncbi:MAG: hypothetical protein RR336_06865 [Oscillospiraceae bacterium]
MTREQQKRNKELKKQIEASSKANYKDYNLKKKDYMFYIVRDKMIYMMMFFMTDGKLLTSFYAKPFWADDLLWDILDMGSNKQEPVSLRAIGAFTIQSKIHETQQTISSIGEVEGLVNNGFAEFVAFSNDYSEENFLDAYPQILYQQDVLRIIVLIHKGQYDEALNLLKVKNIRDFGSNNKCFSELAIEYLKSR